MLTYSQLAFNLNDAVQWTESYNGFSYCAFYNFIVDYFDVTSGCVAKKRADDLLKWWNQYVCYP